MPKAKALVLFSGGLDSILATKVLEAQGIEVRGVCFCSNFYSCDKAKKAAKANGIELEIVDISEEMLELVKNPKSGYGRHLNPCIDCHALMAGQASKIIKKESHNFIATGEVLGQRPFSQAKEALARVEKLAGFEILRPLSAKLLPETKIEKNGLVNRGRLLNIRGRWRTRQMELIEKYNIKEYSTPAGGCLLTDPVFSQRLLLMLERWIDCSLGDVELLKHGRVFWLKLKTFKDRQKVLVVVGRHKEDNEKLEKLAKKGDVIIELKEEMGPFTVARIKNYELRIKDDLLKVDVPVVLKKSELKLNEEKDKEEILQVAGILTGWYATKARGKRVRLEVRIKK